MHERAFLVGVEVRRAPSLLSLQDSLDELEQLALTAGLTVVGRTYQRLSAIHAATYLGSGKVEELRLLRRELKFDVVLFDEELSPAQLRNLENLLEGRVIDRTALILDIFAKHARTREGALQVELAQYAYRLPRLTRQWTHLSRQTVGGVGLRGPGETQLEVDRREIGRRMAQLRQELEQVRHQRSLQRRRRRRMGMPVIAIIGYTNAGKSTLLNRLAHADVLVEDKLFATLDPTTRRVSLPSGKEVLFTDTVGFIQKLPTELVASFRATLEEVGEADILVHLADITDHSILEKTRAVEDVLQQIEVGAKPTILVLNKVDLIDPETDLTDVTTPFVVQNSILSELGARYEHVVAISAEQGVGIDELLSTLEEVLASQMVERDVLLPYQASDLVSLWRKQGIVESETYQAKGIHMHGKLPRWIAGLVDEESLAAPRSG